MLIHEFSICRFFVVSTSISRFLKFLTFRFLTFPIFQFFDVPISQLFNLSFGVSVFDMSIFHFTPDGRFFNFSILQVFEFSIFCTSIFEFFNFLTSISRFSNFSTSTSRFFSFSMFRCLIIQFVDFSAFQFPICRFFFYTSGFWFLDFSHFGI